MLALLSNPTQMKMHVVYWNELISELDAKNIKLLVGEPINHLLRISDLHITHNVCTTTIEYDDGNTYSRNTYLR